jgi:hypothetical protein
MLKFVVHQPRRSHRALWPRGEIAIAPCGSMPPGSFAPQSAYFAGLVSLRKTQSSAVAAIATAVMAR